MNALFNRVGQFVDVDPGVFGKFNSIPHRIETKQAGEMLVQVGQKVESIFIIQSGWAIRYRILDDGRRQILNFMLPGDFFDIMSLTQAESDHFVSAATQVTLRRISATHYLNAMSTEPRLATAFWWVAIQEEAILREQIVRVGRRSAIERVGHLILELNTRIGILDGEVTSHLPLPVPQSLFADALGLSIVHISRTLTSLKSKNMIESTKGGITILDREGMSKLTNFDSDYLRLDKLRIKI